MVTIHKNVGHFLKQEQAYTEHTRFWEGSDLKSQASAPLKTVQHQAQMQKQK
jgi:hypothetical protein